MIEDNYPISSKNLDILKFNLLKTISTENASFSEKEKTNNTLDVLENMLINRCV